MDLLLTLGIVVVAGLIGGWLAQELKLPSVTGYLLIGVLLGPSVTNLVTTEDMAALDPVTAFAMGLIVLSIGAELRWPLLRSKWQNFGLLFIGESLGTFVLVTAAVYLVSRSLAVALMLGVLSLAPAPTSILGIMREHNARGPFPRVVMSLVALDNLWCILAFTIVTTTLNLHYFGMDAERGLLAHVTVEIGGALALGACLGLAGITLANRVRLPRQRLLLVTAIIFLLVGLSRQLGISYLLVALVTGAMVANLTPNPKRFFENIEAIDPPVLILFLTLAGANLQLQALPTLGLLGSIYILSRLTGKLLGSRLGDATCRLLSDQCSMIAPEHRRQVGLALTPQAGVAVGLALLAEERLPLPEGVIVTVILGSVIFFGLIGPVLVLRALRKTQSLGVEDS